MLEAISLSKTYDHHPALTDLNLTVGGGDVYCLLGANGAGKTTTINLFMNFISPTSGQAKVNGLDVAQGQEVKKHLAYIPENLNLYGTLTGMENLQFFAGLGGTPLGGEKPDKAVAEELLRGVGLSPEFIHRRVSKYSKGMRQKVGIAIAKAKHVWVIACIILPKATTNLADKLYPAPSQFEFQEVIEKKVKNGIDGHNPSDVRLASLKEEVLQEHGVATIEELPVNWSGIAMQAGEEYTDQVYDQEFSGVESIFHRQNRLSEWVGFLNPYLAIRHLSMALAGTDFTHHVTFARAAENYRRDFVKLMNQDMEVNHKPTIAYSVGSQVAFRIPKL